MFSHWIEHPDGRVESKIDLVRQMQAAGYFVVLFFIGVSNAQLSVARVATRVRQGGHAVDSAKLRERFPRTQKAIRVAASVDDAALLLDNSRGPEDAFTVCHVRSGERVLFDVRAGGTAVAPAILSWLDVVIPPDHMR